MSDICEQYQKEFEKVYELILKILPATPSELISNLGRGDPNKASELNKMELSAISTFFKVNIDGIWRDRPKFFGFGQKEIKYREVSDLVYVQKTYTDIVWAVESILDCRDNSCNHTYPSSKEVLQEIRNQYHYKRFNILLGNCMFDSNFELNITPETKIKSASNYYHKARRVMVLNMKETHRLNEMSKNLFVCNLILVESTDVSLDIEKLGQSIVLALRLQYWAGFLYPLILKCAEPNRHGMNSCRVRACGIGSDYHFVGDMWGRNIINTEKFCDDLPKIYNLFQKSEYKNYLIRTLFATSREFGEDAILDVISSWERLFGFGGGAKFVVGLAVSNILKTDLTGIVNKAYRIRNEYSHGEQLDDNTQEKSIELVENALKVISVELDELYNNKRETYRENLKQELIEFALK